MIVVSSALKQEEIKQSLVDNGFIFKSKQGLNLIFDHEDSPSDAIAKAKVIIKGTAYGKVLYFSVNEKK